MSSSYYHKYSKLRIYTYIITESGNKVSSDGRYSSKTAYFVNKDKSVHSYNSYMRYTFQSNNSTATNINSYFEFTIKEDVPDPCFLIFCINGYLNGDNTYFSKIELVP